MRVAIGNWLYNAGIIGFLRILKETAVDTDTIVKQEYLDITPELLDGFEERYFKFTLKRIAETSLFLFKDMRKVLEKVNSSSNFYIGYLNRVYSVDLEKSFNKYRDATLEIVSEYYDDISCSLSNLLSGLKLQSPSKKEAAAIERIMREVEKQKSGKIQKVKDYILFSNYWGNFFFNKLVLNNPKGKTNRLGRFKDTYIKNAIATLEGNQIADGLKCKFCGTNLIPSQFNYTNQKLQNYVFDEGNFSPLGVSTTFENFFYDLTPDLFLCPVCELLLLCSFAGFTPKNNYSLDSDETDHIFVNLPSIPTMWSANQKLEVLYREKQRDSIYEEVISDMLQKEAKGKAMWTLHNILFIEIKPTPRKDVGKPVMKYFHIGKDLAELFIQPQTSTMLRNIGGYLEVKKGKNAQNVNLKSETIKRLFRNENLYHLASISAKQALDEEKENIPYQSVFAIAAIQTLRKQVNLKYQDQGGEHMEAKQVYGILRGFYKRGEDDFSEVDFKKKERMAYRFLSLIRMGKYADFYEAVMKLYITSNKPIPDNLLDILNQESSIDFEAKAYAFMSGFLSGVESSQQPIKKEEVTND
jgi:CRISPR-associated protein Cst1